VSSRPKVIVFDRVAGYIERGISIDMDIKPRYTLTLGASRFEALQSRTVSLVSAIAAT